MRKFISKVQNLSQRAAELKVAMQQVPPKVAEIREAVAMTTGQLRQLRTDVEAGVADLKADNEHRLMESLHEINGSTEVFAQAGYELGAVDIELSPVQKLVVHLNRLDDVDKARLLTLLAKNQQRRVTYALLRSIIQAEEMADQVDLTNLVYHKLIVHIGPIPCVRLCWKTEEELAAPLQTQAQPRPVQVGIAPAKPASQSASPSAFASYGKSSFFEPKETSSHVCPEPAAATSTAAAHTATTPAVEPVATSVATKKDWGKESLERFKKMPSVSKYRR
jgi:hypothetical protein